MTTTWSNQPKSTAGEGGAEWSDSNFTWGSALTTWIGTAGLQIIWTNQQKS